MPRSMILAVLLPVLCACQWQALPPPAAGPAGGWSQASVWAGADPAAACRPASGAAADDCVVRGLRALGAGNAALIAATELSASGQPGYVSQWQTLHGIGVATVTWPLRANTVQGIWLVASDGQRLAVDAGVLQAAPPLPADVAAWLVAHPKASTFAPAALAGPARPQPDGGVSLVFATPLRDCHACPTLAMLQREFVFDAAGRHRATHLLGLTAD